MNYKVISNVDPNKLGNTITIGKTKDLTLQFVIEDYLVHMESHLRNLVV